MDLAGARVLVCGASGVLGAALSDALHAAGARVVAAGRDQERTAAVAGRCGTTPLTFDVIDVRSCRQVVDAAAEQLGGLDVLVVTTGVAAFGPAVSADAAVVEELFAVNTLGPMALVRAAAAHLPPGGAVVVVSAILADSPTTGMAEYSATKSALAAWLSVLRREQRRAFTVLDVRPPHMDTGLADHPLAGQAPALPGGHPLDDTVTTTLDALRAGKREVVWDASAKALVIR
ncbi:SDR family NAD(P)-dependent oxidoreductase [Dermatophilaceae bacterium Soc4.6]